jgi:tRNA (mo5U34)-methyltransferase
MKSDLELSSMKWFHSFKFDDGEEINGAIPYKTLKDREKYLDLVDFSNKSILDIGCWDGYYSAYASKRGASYVTGIDIGPWGNDTWQNKFDYVMGKTGCNNVCRHNLSVYDASGPKLSIPFDIVMFMGVLYHLKHPLLALENVRKVTGKTLILETHVSCSELNYPAMKFYPGTELNNDASNWWSPNIQCLEDMLRCVGFTNINTVAKFPSAKDNRVIMICE